MSELLDVDIPTTPPGTHERELGTHPPYKLHRRFDRAARLFGEAAMARLAQAHVKVFGLGGVGSYAAEALVRSGVGKLTLVDFDEVCVTNTNRQLHCMKGTYGKSKAALMAERCQLINPDAQIEGVSAFYSADTADGLLPAGQEPSYVLDAIDNMKAKLHLLHTCIRRHIPVISSMGAAGRMDPTQVRVGELCDTTHDPFAKDVRKLLRLKYAVDTSKPCGVRVVFSPERRINPQPLSYDQGAGFLCVCPNKENAVNTCDRRMRVDGTASFVTGSFGFLAASAVVRSIVEAGV
jgi:tRNA A37 threonylcarbamoyladenosine dehydratase